GGSGSGGGSLIGGLLYLIVFLIITSILWYKRRKKIEAAKAVIEAAAIADDVWQADLIKKHVRDTFLRFQQDWSNFNTDSMRSYLSDSYFRRMVLELNVLQDEGRRNLMENVSCSGVAILEATDHQDDSNDKFVAEVKGTAKDSLLDERNNKMLYMDTSSFTEYWTFIRSGDDWKLDLIRQQTENKALGEKKIEEFALRNGFFYDPDFGWLMMPNKGVIFKKSNFKISDINNHVIGYFRDKIVEFFTYIPGSSNNNSYSANYIVAQTVIPKSYNNILVRRKRMLFNFGPWGLRRIRTESNEFDNKFCLWADRQDQISSFELLTPNFMERIYDLPFELNIEVVGNFLYFYAKSRKDVDYDKMLEILSWAFDEMER
ncbi:MAG: hypothetical protein ACD_5C00027G0001, partial [uncultured bacterium]